MRMLGWNIRGFGRCGCCSQLKDYIRKEKIDVVCLQEMIKASFTDQELKSLDP
jgi:exonuclease III